MPELGGGGPEGPLAPQYFADLLTLFQLGRADYPHLLLLAPPQKEKKITLPASLRFISTEVTSYKIHTLDRYLKVKRM